MRYEIPVPIPQRVIPVKCNLTNPHTLISPPDSDSLYIFLSFQSTEISNAYNTSCGQSSTVLLNFEKNR